MFLLIISMITSLAMNDNLMAVNELEKFFEFAQFIIDLSGVFFGLPCYVMSRVCYFHDHVHNDN